MSQLLDSAVWKMHVAFAVQQAETIKIYYWRLSDWVNYVQKIKPNQTKPNHTTSSCMYIKLVGLSLRRVGCTQTRGDIYNVYVRKYYWVDYKLVYRKLFLMAGECCWHENKCRSNTNNGPSYIMKDLHHISPSSSSSSLRVRRLLSLPVSFSLFL